MRKSAMPVLCRALVPEVLPAVLPDLPAVPDVLPAPPPELVLPSRLPADLPAEGRAALAAALEGSLPGGQRPQRGELVRESVPSCWNDEEISRLRGFLRTVEDGRGRQGRSYSLEYLLALPLIAGMAGDGELDAAAEWAGTAPEELLLRLGAPLDREGKPRRPDATTLGRALAGCDQGQYDDAGAVRDGGQAPGRARRHDHAEGRERAAGDGGADVAGPVAGVGELGQAGRGQAGFAGAGELGRRADHQVRFQPGGAGQFQDLHAQGDAGGPADPDHEPAAAHRAGGAAAGDRPEAAK